MDAWSIISYSGFTGDGLHAFGRGKRAAAEAELAAVELQSTSVAKSLPSTLAFMVSVQSVLGVHG